MSDLSGVNVAGRPPDLGTQFRQRFNQNLLSGPDEIKMNENGNDLHRLKGNTNGRLGVDVGTADNFGSFQRPIFAGPSPQRHNAGHF